MYLRDKVTPWVITALVLFTLAAFTDIGLCGSMSWGYTETDSIYTHLGLFRICNGTRQITRRDKVELRRSKPDCFRSLKLEFEWMTWAVVMECIGLIASVASLFAVVAFLISLRRDWIYSRSALVGLIPIGICAAAFNFFGAASMGINLSDVRATPQYGLGLDVVAGGFFAAGAILCVLDIQGCCMKRPPISAGKGLTRPI